MPLRTWQEVYNSRQAKLKREGSPYFNWIVPAIAALGVAYIDIYTQFPLARRFEPLDEIEVSNNGANVLVLVLNGGGAGVLGNGDSFPVPNGVIRKISSKPIWRIAITNADAVNATILGTILVTIRKMPKTIDQWAREH